MNAGVETRWAMAVRVLALISAVLTVVVVLEARAIRELRSELQNARAQQAKLEAGPASPSGPCAQ
jgi:hypothetical protein